MGYVLKIEKLPEQTALHFIKQCACRCRRYHL